MGVWGGAHNRFHHYQGHHGGLCVKRVYKKQHRKQLPCGKPRRDEVHLYYPCLDPKCTYRSYSIDQRLEHMELQHG